MAGVTYWLQVMQSNARLFSGYVEYNKKITKIMNDSKLFKFTTYPTTQKECTKTDK